MQPALNLNPRNEHEHFGAYGDRPHGPATSRRAQQGGSESVPGGVCARQTPLDDRAWRFRRPSPFEWGRMMRLGWDCLPVVLFLLEDLYWRLLYGRWLDTSNQLFIPVLVM